MQMARSRQQMLSSMVILGINRIVVTDGLINAKVVFDFRASDEMMRDANAGLTDTQSSMNRNTTKASIGLPWSGASTKNENVQRHMTTVSSSVSGVVMVNVLSLPSQLTLSRTAFGTLLRLGFSDNVIATGRTTTRPA